MNKLITSLLMFAIAAFSVCAAENPAPKQPVNLIKAMDALLTNSSNGKVEKKDTRLNPETGLLESNLRILTMYCPKDSKYLIDVMKAFDEDQDCGYQYSFIDKNNNEQCSVSTGLGMETLHSPGAETWMMCVKNELNPSLRDVYAMTVTPENSSIMAVTLYYITSPRPDIRQPIASRGGIFSIRGEVDNSVASDFGYVYAYLGQGQGSPAYSKPLKDNKFSFSIPVDGMEKVQLFLVRPNGELSEYWTALDLIPDFTLEVQFRQGVFILKNGTDYIHEVNRYRGGNSVKLTSASTESNTRLEELKKAMDVYKDMAKKLNDEINQLNLSAYYPEKKETIKQLNQQLRETYKKMQVLVEKYAAEMVGE